METRVHIRVKEAGRSEYCNRKNSAFMSYSLFYSKRFPLKPIILIRLPPSNPGKQRTQQISRQKNRPPAFRLPDMDALMTPRGIQKIGRPADHHMPQSHRRCSPFHHQSDNSSQIKFAEPAIHFQHAIHHLSTPAAEKSRRRQNQSRRGRRKYPDINDPSRHHDLIVVPPSSHRDFSRSRFSSLALSSAPIHNPWTT
jgi:hypothetical protein